MIEAEKYQQNLSDLGYVISKLAMILQNRELSNEEKRDLDYCEKVIKQVNEKIKENVS